MQLAVKIKFLFQNGHASQNMGHNQSKNCEILYFSPSKLKCVHRKLNKIEFGCKFHRICHLGRYPAIITDVICQNAMFKILDYLPCICKLSTENILDIIFLFVNRFSKFLWHILGQSKYYILRR